MKPMVKPDEVTLFNDYILLYIGSILSIYHDAEDVLKRLDYYFNLKPGSLGYPDIYLEVKLQKIKMHNVVWAWIFISERYVHESVKNVKKYLAQNLGGWWKFSGVPFSIGYLQELSESSVLEHFMESYYRSWIRILGWMVEIGRIYINTEVILLSSQLVLLQEGHFDTVFQIFAYLRQKYNSRLGFDTTHPYIDMSYFREFDWKQLYGDAMEEITPNTSEPMGKEVDLQIYVDSDHTGDKFTRLSRTGFIIFINTALIRCLYKKQPTIQTSFYGD